MNKYLISAALLAVMTGAVLASAEDDSTSLSYISYLERYATVQPATQEESLEAVANMPLVAGDRVDTAREARVEVYLADGSIIWLDEYTSVSLDAVAFSRDSHSDRTVLFLSEGKLILEIPEYAAVAQASRVDGARGTVYLNRPGLYRVEVVGDGELWVETWEGLAEAASSAGGVLVRPESAATIAGGVVEASYSEPTADDDFALWVAERRRGVTGESAQHVDGPYHRQAAQLDSYGSWVHVDGYDSWAWRPAVDTGWRPYTAGRWYWTPTGWAWISYEPWGWLPYHYGSWWFDNSYGWLWSWNSYWSPAWVSWMHWPGYIGWCPSGYYDYWWWHDYGYEFGWHDCYGCGGHGGNPPHDGGAPRPGHRRVDIGLAQPIKPSRVTLNLNGRVNLRDVDPRGWSVAPVAEFGSPQLSRLVRSGEEALRDAGDLRAVVSSAPLMTPRTPQDRLGGELERVMGRVDVTRDLGPVLARDPSMRPEVAITAVNAEPVERASRRAAPTTAPRLDSEALPRPVLGQSPDSRRQEPNLHRSVLPPDNDSRRVQPERRAPTGRSDAPVVREHSSRPPSASPAPSRSEGRVVPRAAPQSGSGSSVSPRSSGSTSPRSSVAPRTSSDTRRPSGSTSPRSSVTPRTSSDTRRSSGSASVNRWGGSTLQPRSGSSGSTHRASPSPYARSAPAPSRTSPTIRPPSGSSSSSRPSAVRPSSPSSSSSSSSSARSSSGRSSGSSSSSKPSSSSGRSSGSSSSSKPSSSSGSSGSKRH